MRHVVEILVALAIVIPCMAQVPRTPDVQAQRTAMKKLGFLVGKWSGIASLLRAGGETVQLIQTEEARYRLDGLVLVIEGVGRINDKPVLQALGIVTYDDLNATYRMRAYNDGRWLETDVKLLENAKGMSWGFALEGIKTSSVLQINDKGEWTEHAELIVGSQPPRTLMDLSVSPVEP